MLNENDKKDITRKYSDEMKDNFNKKAGFIPAYKITNKLFTQLQQLPLLLQESCASSCLQYQPLT